MPLLHKHPENLLHKITAKSEDLVLLSEGDSVSVMQDPHRMWKTFCVAVQT